MLAVGRAYYPMCPERSTRTAWCLRRMAPWPQEGGVPTGHDFALAGNNARSTLCKDERAIGSLHPGRV
nr:hypothetical protein CFP56_13049 [Quercus suber]